MRHHLLQPLLLPLAILFSLVVPSHQLFAASSVQCHCFTNRSYNPADKFATDEYLTTTSFNSLVSKAFDIPKRQIVMIKMSEGVAQDDLLISLKLAKLTGIDLRKFLGLRRENKTWPDIIEGLQQVEAVQNDAILTAIKDGSSAVAAGEMIADEMIAGFYQLPIEEIHKFRKSGLNEKEMALLFILSHASGIEPDALVQQYTYHGKSWSEIAHSLGLETKAAGMLILVYPANTIP